MSRKATRQANQLAALLKPMPGIWLVSTSEDGLVIYLGPQDYSDMRIATEGKTHAEKAWFETAFLCTPSEQLRRLLRLVSHSFRPAAVLIDD